VYGLERVGVRLAERAPAGRERSPVQFLSLGVLALLLEHHGDVAHRAERVGVVVAQCPPSGGEGLTVQLFGSGVLPLILEYLGFEFEPGLAFALGRQLRPVAFLGDTHVRPYGQCGERRQHDPGGRDAHAVLADSPGEEVRGRRLAGRERLSGEVVADVEGEIAGRSVPLVGIVGQGFQEERLEIPVNRLAQFPRAAHVFLGGPAQELITRARGTVREFAGEQAEQDHAEAVDVASCVDLGHAAGGLLGRHIGGRAGNVALDRYRRPRVVAQESLCEAEVEDLRAAVVRHHYVRRLQVTVDHAMLVGVSDGGAHGVHQLQDLPLGQFALGNVVGQLRPLDQLHRVVTDALLHSAVVNASDVGMFELGGQLDLALEARPGLVRGERADAEYFQGDFAPGAELDGAPDGAHPTFADALDDFVPGYLRRRSRGGGRTSGLADGRQGLVIPRPRHHPSSNRFRKTPAASSAKSDSSALRRAGQGENGECGAGRRTRLLRLGASRGAPGGEGAGLTSGR